MQYDVRLAKQLTSAVCILSCSSNSYSYRRVLIRIYFLFSFGFLDTLSKPHLDFPSPLYLPPPHHSTQLHPTAPSGSSGSRILIKQVLSRLPMYMYWLKILMARYVSQPLRNFYQWKD